MLTVHYISSLLCIALDVNWIYKSYVSVDSFHQITNDTKIEISLQKPGKESQNVCICKSDSSLYFLLEKTSEDKLSN